jgi:hypothetical protein
MMTSLGCMGMVQHMEHGMCWTVWAAWGQALSCNTMTSLMSMSGPFFLMVGSESFAVMLCGDGDIRILDGQSQQFIGPVLEGFSSWNSGI